METSNYETKSQSQRDGEEQSESVLSLRDAWDFLCAQWKWIVLSVIVCVGAAKLYLATKNNVYQRQAVMLVKQENGSSRRTDALTQINGMVSGSGVANEMFVLGTRQLAGEVAQKLHLDVLYTTKQKFRTVSLYDEKPFEVQFMDENTIPATFKVKVLNAKEVEMSEYDESGAVKKVKFGERAKTPVGTFVMIPNSKTIRAYRGKEVTVSHLSKESATNSVAGRITTGEVAKEASLVSIVCVDTNRKRADDILNTLFDVYKNSIVEDKNKVAESTASFIEERIRLVGSELSEVEGNLASFKQANNLVDIQTNAQAYMTQSSSARMRTVQLQSELATVNYLLDYLKKTLKGDNLIPNLGGLGDQGIQSQIDNYNQMRLQRNRLAENSSESNATVAALDANMAEMRHSLISSVEGYANSVRVQVSQAQQEERALSGSIQNVPQQEKKAIDISRQQAIKEALYTYLLNKREETALQLAVTEANVRLVEPPYGSNAPISPRSNMVLLAGLVMGLALPIIIFYIYSIFNMGVRGRKDVEALTTIPILGEIPRSHSDRNDHGIVVDEKSDDVLSEAFRVMRYNLGFLNKDAKVIMFTSTMPAEGKSFVSRNFAYSLAVGKTKVVLVDCDIRRHTQSVVMRKNRSHGLTSYLGGTVDDIDSLIQTAQEGTNVQMMPAGPTPPNPTELLMNDRMQTLIEYLKQKFDYVILDSVPAHMMADAAVVSRLSDLTVYVIRDGGIDRRYLPELERIHLEGRYTNLCALVNGTVEHNGSYGYYGYRYGYKYGYKYGYRREDGSGNRGLLSRLRRKFKKSHHKA